MANKTPTDIEKVSELIDKYTEEYLDSYIRATAKEKAGKALKTNGHTPETVADTVFDYIHNNHSGNAVMANICQQICPKPILYLMRNDIIAALK